MGLSFKIYLLTWGGSRGILFPNTVRNKLVRASSKSSVIAVVCRSDLTLETTVTELGNLNGMGVIGSWGGRHQMVVFNAKGTVGMVTVIDISVKAAIRTV